MGGKRTCVLTPLQAFFVIETDILLLPFASRPAAATTPAEEEEQQQCFPDRTLSGTADGLV
jgi:hypothetical protein